MTTFVLVHGAWGGAQSFRFVRPLLHKEGHEVFTPSLTGIGERAHLASPMVNLSTHVLDVANAVLYEDLCDIVLLGYSYGGMVVTGALEHLADRVAHLVYLDAFVPENGQCLNELTGRPNGTAGLLGSPWLAPPMGRAFEDEELEAFELARRSPHPTGCFEEPVRLGRALEDFAFTRTYIKAVGLEPMGEVDPFWRFAKPYAASASWRSREVTCDHLIPLKKPEELVELLLELV